MFCWPYLGEPALWLFLIFISVTHYVQDWAKIKFTLRSNHGLLFFLIDQLLHILFLGVVFWTRLQSLKPPVSGNTFFITWYNNNALVLYLTAIIITSYTAHYIILIIKKDYLKQDSPVGPFEKRYGFLERVIILSFFLSGGLWALSIPFILALRILLFKTLKDRLKVTPEFASGPEIALSGTAGILTGVVFCMFI